MNATATCVLSCSMLLALVAPTLAHHSAAAYDTQKEVKITATSFDIDSPTRTCTSQSR